ncbi:MAG: hypothetical protein ACFCVF_01345 [Kineosporiaceae bacterium]
MSGTPGEDALTRRLRAAAASHHPDVERVVSRVMRDTAIARPTGRAPGRRGWDLPGWLLPVVASAATVTVIAVAVAVLRPDGTVVPANPSPIGTAAPSVPPPSATAAPSVPPPSATAAPSVPPPSDPPAPTSEEPPDPPTDVTAATGIAVVALSEPATRLTLSPASGRDWLVGGTDEASPYNVARRDATEELLGIGVSGDFDVATEPGPFEVSWSGGTVGQPTGSTGSWFLISDMPGGTAVDLQLLVEPAADRERVVALVGVEGAGSRIEVLVDGTVTTSAAVADDSATPTPYQVSVPLSSLPDDSRVEVRVLVPEGGSAGLAAATLE